MTVRSAEVDARKSKLKVKLTKEQIQEIKDNVDTKDEPGLKIYGVEVEKGSDYVLQLRAKEVKGSSHRDFLPTWDLLEKYEPLELFEFHDRGLDADPELRGLFSPLDRELYTVKDLSPKFGSEIDGTQLSSLTNQGKNDLARYVAERGVVIFRNQDLTYKGPQFATKFGEYFGPLHIHPTSGAARNAPALHLVYRPGTSSTPGADRFAKYNRGIFWHTDITYEKQPAGTTFLTLLDGPIPGGDTVYVDTVEAYNRLSPEFQKIIEGLKVVHRGLEPLKETDESPGFLRCKGLDSVVHPLVRTHPVTGVKSLFVNELLTSHIEGLKTEESKAILTFLYDHLSKSVDLHLRTKYEKDTVVVWDNRRTAHTWTFDWDVPTRRHLFRITPRAEVPTL